MTRTIAALFDTQADAEAGKQRLLDANIGADHVHIHDKTADGFDQTGYSAQPNGGMWGKIKNAVLPQEDRHTYEEGVRRGGYLLHADVEDAHVDPAVAALEAANGVDIDQRASNWRSEGWDYDAGTAAAVGDRRKLDGEEVIPVVEEQLVVGKREVGRGGVRVRSYVTETPVHEQVRLLEEKVMVERRAVDRPVSDVGADAFRERTVEMTETNEEAVVGKTVRVVEEVVVSKTAGERVADISDTVRRTDVEVEDIAGSDRRASGSGESLSEKVKDAIGGLTGGDRP